MRWTEEARKIQSDKIKFAIKEGVLVLPVNRSVKTDKMCECCQSHFQVRPCELKRRYCSVACRQKEASNNIRGTTGGGKRTFWKSENRIL